MSKMWKRISKLVLRFMESAEHQLEVLVRKTRVSKSLLAQLKNVYIVGQQFSVGDLFVQVAEWKSRRHT